MNAIAKNIRTPKYKKRVVQNKKKYDRKRDGPKSLKTSTSKRIRIFSS